MRYYVLKPEVGGGFGPETTFVDRKARPPVIAKLHYEFNVWLGDPIVETVCIYIVTESVRDKIVAMRATGASFDPVVISTTYPFEEISKHRNLPAFVWLRVTGFGGHDDFGYGPSNDAYLVVSEPILDMFLESGMSHCDFIEMDEWKGEESPFRRTK